jgi:C1A family cysteine protease
LNGTQVSAQQIVDCTWGIINYACQGGHADDAFYWFINRSLPILAESDYPYIGVSGPCQKYSDGGPFRPIGKVTGCWETPQFDDNYLKQAIYQRGPLAVAIIAGIDSFVNWQPNDSEPYHDPKCNSSATLDHWVLVIGWKDYGNGVWAWEIENSWSELWGDHGYGFIRGGVVDEVRSDCGITLNAMQPEVVLF